MKKIILRITSAVVISSFGIAVFSCGSGSNTESSGDKLEGTLTISGAFALYPLAVKWGEEFKKKHPNVEFNISAGGAGKGIADALGGLADIAMVSRDLKDAEKEKGGYPIAVTKDAVVPTINSNNPNANEILQKGLSKEAFIKLFLENSVSDWRNLGFSQSSQVHVYTRSDAAGAAESWAKYLGKKQEDLKGVGVFGDPGLLQAVMKDASGVGYNNIGYAYNIKTKQPLQGVTVVPIDVNGNGVVDADEKVYGHLDTLLNAINTGKFPSPPARDLFLMTKGKSTNPVVIEFIKWVLTEGQQYVTSSGYVTFPKEKLEEELKKLK